MINLSWLVTLMVSGGLLERTRVKTPPLTDRPMGKWHASSEAATAISGQKEQEAEN